MCYQQHTNHSHAVTIARILVLMIAHIQVPILRRTHANANSNARKKIYTVIIMAVVACIKIVVENAVIIKSSQHDDTKRFKCIIMLGVTVLTIGETRLVTTIRTTIRMPATNTITTKHNTPLINHHNKNHDHTSNPTTNRNKARKTKPS